MNELEWIRRQLSAERSHAREVALACAQEAKDGQQTDELRQARVGYLVFVLTRFDERDQILADLDRRLADSILHGPGGGREALARLEAALTANATDAPARWEDFSEYFDGPWRARRDAVDAALAQNTRIADWRAVSFVDADSIVQERSLYARTQPPGSHQTP